MLATKRFDNPTIPTNREVCFEHFRNFFRFQFIPPDRSAFGAVKRWLVVEQIDLPELFSARNAFLAVVPFDQNVAKQAVLRRKLDMQ